MASTNNDQRTSYGKRERIILSAYEYDSEKKIVSEGKPFSGRCTLIDWDYREPDLRAEVHDWVIVQADPVNLSDPEGLVAPLVALAWVGGGAAAGGGINAVAQIFTNGWNNFSWGSFAASTAAGGLAGGLGLATTGMSAGWSILLNTSGSAAISGSVTYAQNQLAGTCNNVQSSAISGALFGGAGSIIGVALPALGSMWANMKWSNATLTQKLFASASYRKS